MDFEWGDYPEHNSFFDPSALPSSAQIIEANRNFIENYGLRQESENRYELPSRWVTEGYGEIYNRLIDERKYWYMGRELIMKDLGLELLRFEYSPIEYPCSKIELLEIENGSHI